MKPNETRAILLAAGGVEFALPLRSGLLCGLLVTGSAGLCADEAAPDKRQFHLFKPTPRALMREMSTDRPDKTEAPFTVDAGHFQIEMDLVSYGYDRDRFDSDWIYGVDARLTYSLTADIQLDGGVNVGLTRESEDVHPFVGLSIRF